MLLNLTNHPAAAWPQDEYSAAVAQWGEVCDEPFPNVRPDCSTEEIAAMAEEITASVLVKAPAAVLCQGEMSLCFALVRGLQRAGLPVYCATTQRIAEVTQLPDGTTKKSSVFRFVMFREYTD